MKSKYQISEVVKELELKNILKALLFNNGVIEIIWDTSISEIEVLHLAKMQEAVCKLGNGNKMPIYFTAHDFLQLSKEGGKFAASKEGVRYTMACAVLIDNLSKKLIFNFFQKFNKPIVPTKAFSDKKDAFSWLEEQKHHLIISKEK